MKKNNNVKPNNKALYIVNIVIAIVLLVEVLALRGLFVEEVSDSRIGGIDLGFMVSYLILIPTIIIAFVFNIMLIVKKGTKAIKYIFLIPTLLGLTFALTFYKDSSKPAKTPVVDTFTCELDGEETEYNVHKEKTPEGEYVYHVGKPEKDWMTEEDDYYSKIEKGSFKEVKEGITEIYKNHGGSCK